MTVTEVAKKAIELVPAKWQTRIITPILLLAIGALAAQVWAGRKDNAAALASRIQATEAAVSELKTAQAADEARGHEAEKRFDDLVRRFDSLEQANRDVLKELRRRDSR